MKNCYLLLTLTIVIFVALNNKVSAQPKIKTVSGLPVIFVSEDGAYKICIGEIKSRSEAEMFLSSLRKKGFKNNVVVNTTSGLKKKVATAIDNYGKIIHYGPWKMQNNLKIPSYDFVSFFNYISEGRKNAAITSAKSKQISKEKNYPSSILELNRNAQLKVIKGQEYSVQVGEFKFDKSAISVLQKISAIANLPVLVIIKNGFYHLLIEGFSDRVEARLLVDKLTQMGFNGIIVKVNNTLN